MKLHLTHFLACTLLGLSLSLCAACGAAEGSGTHGTVRDVPTPPEVISEDLKSLYDFRFSERYDDRVQDDFSLLIPTTGKDSSHILFLLDVYKTQYRVTEDYTLSDDGQVPYTTKRYLSTLGDGRLMIGTDDYEADHVEYISYLWSDLEGVRTNKGIAVGSAEADLLLAYPEALYYMDKEAALSGMDKTALSILSYGQLRTLDENHDFDYVYLWQPYDPAKNDLRDITFFIRDGYVSAIEMQDYPS